MGRLATHGIGQVYSTLGDRWGRTTLFAAAIAACLLAWWIGGAAGVPSEYGRGGSLLSQPHPIWSMATAAVLFLLCVLLFHRIAVSGHEETGLLVAGVGWMALSVHCGPMRYVLFAQPQGSVFLQLAFELILLYAWVGVGWLLLRKLFPKKPEEGDADTLPTGLGAMGVQAVVTASCILLMGVTDNTPQTLMAVGVGALVGSLVAHMTFPLRGDIWFWTGPLLTGLIGYLIAWQYPDGILTGLPQGPMGALARPIPLVYAGAGPVGAIIGLWTAKSWHQADQAEG